MKEILPTSKTDDDGLVVLEQQMALSAYLDALLAPSPESEAPERSPVKKITVSADKEARKAPPAPQIAREASREPPSWAGEAFQALLFRVAGLTLAVPLARLNGVLGWDDGEVTALPGKPAWFLGLRSHQGVQIKLVDTAAVILPPERRGRAVPSMIVLIDDLNWGLVCDEVDEVITLTADAVRWNAGRRRRPWLAGTVIERMCALLDVDQLAGMLAAERLPA